MTTLYNSGSQIKKKKKEQIQHFAHRKQLTVHNSWKRSIFISLSIEVWVAANSFASIDLQLQLLQNFTYHSFSHDFKKSVCVLLGLLSLLICYICTSPPSFSQAANTSNSLIIVNLAATPVFKLLSSADYNGIVVDFPFLYCWYPAFCWDDCLQATAVTFSHSMTFFSLSFFFFF